MPGDRRPRQSKARASPLKGSTGRGKKAAANKQPVEDRKPAPTEEEKAAYRSEIERRFTELGWTEQSMNFPVWSSLKSEWLGMLEPNELADLNDDKVWTNIKERVEYLRNRIKGEREKQKELRFDRLYRLLSALRKSNPPLVSFKLRRLGKPPCTEYPCPPLDYTELRKITHEVAFPGVGGVHKWPVIKSLLDADTTADELEQAFNARRGEIDAMVTEWRDKLHTRLLGFLPKLEGEILRPTLVADGSDPFKHLSDDIKRLLRADSLFTFYDWNDSPYIMNSPRHRPYTYQDILRISAGDVHRLSDLRTQVQLPMDRIGPYPAAQEMARELMKSIARPGASYLELGSEIEGECDWEGASSYEGEWICGRCIDTEPKTWQGIVEHYVDERRKYSSNRAELAKRKLTYHDVHGPASLPNRPLIKFYSAQVALEIMSIKKSERDSYQCQLCSKWPITHSVRGPEKLMFKHLLEVHEVRKPKFMTHYGVPDSYSDFLY
ncbi:hypothetical protein ACGC1H_001100 [Rhizoctonia solani]|uniref:Uncharacterized protein n=1 Tax=Rhizoctonia solani TaxID=456999 RepID=A0A8H3GFI2_9AGAM|nr:unnamed protein product [Rhizoctonia solani]